MFQDSDKIASFPLLILMSYLSLLAYEIYEIITVSGISLFLSFSILNYRPLEQSLSIINRLVRKQ